MSACINGLCRAVTVSLLLLLLSFSFSSACSNGNCQLLDSCSSATDCVSGLYCGDCPAVGRSKPVCTRGQATSPTSIINGLPFNKYTWLMTHNAFSNANAPLLPGVERITFYNQEDTITNQLQNGVRGLMLDMYDFNNDIWLCHSLRGQCFNFTAFQPKGLSTLFANAGLDKYWFPVSKMPRKGEDWPTVTDMVQENHRLLVFTSVASLAIFL